jgi:23S rRNA (adenine2503-C2)-methyltransferase
MNDHPSTAGHCQCPSTKSKSVSNAIDDSTLLSSKNSQEFTVDTLDDKEILETSPSSILEESYVPLDQKLQLLLEELKQPKFRLKQIMEWIYQRYTLDWNQMTNLSQELRNTLSQQLPLQLLIEEKRHLSDDKETLKFLWRLHDGYAVESVLIYSSERRTLCVSSQVGCGARCAFCASGKQGWKRNLNADEIIQQLILVNNFLKTENEKVTHIVFMGMGEPLENYDNVLYTIQKFVSPSHFNISQRRITVSTVGIIDKIHRLSTEGLKVNLVLSLHAPNQKLRQRIIPYARKYPLELILEAMDTYAASTKRDITYEYTLLAGINDSTIHAEELATLIGRRQATINLIPYNPVVGLQLQRPSTEAIQAFRKVLDQKGMLHTCRYTKGVDIAAACGQLALQAQIEKPEPSLASN